MALHNEVTDAQINAVFKGTNYGDDTIEFRRRMIAECILKKMAGYRDSHTTEQICVDLGLITHKGNTSMPGRRFAMRTLCGATSDKVLDSVCEECVLGPVKKMQTNLDRQSSIIKELRLQLSISENENDLLRRTADKELTNRRLERKS